jgi:hypothetical protein
MLVARLAMVIVVWLVGVLLPPPNAVALAAPPRLVARWERPGVARIVWHEPGGVGLTCLSRNGVLIRCWNDLPAERYIMLLGSVGPLDEKHHPLPGDVFALEQDGAPFRARLEGVIYLPAFRILTSPCTNYP